MVRVNWNDARTSLRLHVMMGIVAAFMRLSSPNAAVAAQIQQQTFASPEQAEKTLIAAVRAGSTADLIKIFGAEGKKLVFSGDPLADKTGRQKFTAAYAKMNELKTVDGDKAVILIGEDRWPFPIPIVKQGDAWHFDTEAGAQEIIDRRVGRNELNTIQVCRAYVDAQREYASRDRVGSGLLEYAQKFVSSAGKHDGLYWEVNPGEEESPMGPLVARARAEGYSPKDAKGKHKHTPYHGYYYKILTRQGKDAPEGPHDYIVNGHMIGGFALTAFPAKYGDSGIMTFVINHDGIVYEKNLGPQSAATARHMTEFNPDATWKKAP